MNWLLLIIILQVLLGRVFSDFKCLSSNECSCTKHPDNDAIKAIVCAGSYTIHIKTGYRWARVEIECYSDQILQWGHHFYQINITTLVISKCRLSDTAEVHQIITTLGFNEVQEIELSGIRFNGSLEKSYLTNLESLNELIIKETHLILSNESFEGTPYLNILKLNNNDIDHIPKDVFKQLKLLKHLNLQGNKITVIDGDLFDGILLTHLYLENNYLTFLSLKLRTLESLNLSSNQLTTLNLSIQHLRYLDVANNRLSHFEPESLNVPKLKYLDLSSNKISNLNSNNFFLLHYLVDVELINLSDNHINCLDSGWLNLTNLRIIDLSSNNFTVLSLKEIKYFNHKVEKIILRFNPLESIDFSNLETFIKTPPPSHWNEILIELSSNKFICDCRNYEFARFLHNQMPPTIYKYFQIKQNLICNDDLRTKFLNLNIDKLTTCNWEIFKDLNKTDCMGECECIYRIYDNSALMNCANKNLTLAPEKIIFSRNLNYTELNLRNNSITKLPNYKNDNIKKLNVGYNNLNTINITQLPKNLMILNLDHNNLTVVSDTNNTLSNIRMLTMSSNPWTCDCAAKNTLHFIQKYFSKIIDSPNITCHQSSTLLYTLNTEKLCEEKSNTATIVAVSFFLAVLFSLFLGLSWIAYSNYSVKLWLYSHRLTWLISEECLDQDKKYDAFLSFSHEDIDLVAEHLLPGLEQGTPPFKVCIHYRDWVLGGYIPAQIARSVEESRRTIIVLSQHFLDSVWGKMEFRAAYINSLIERRSRIIVILYGDVSTNDCEKELKLYLSTNTYVKWGDSWFWEKLRDALRHTPHTKNKTRTAIKDAVNTIPSM